MAKEEMACNHCGDKIVWYRRWLHETRLKEVDDKFYCIDCLKKMAIFIIEEEI